MGGPENGIFPYVGGWVVQKCLKAPLCNIKMAPKAKKFENYHFKQFGYIVPPKKSLQNGKCGSFFKMCLHFQNV